MGYAASFIALPELSVQTAQLAQAFLPTHVDESFGREEESDLDDEDSGDERKTHEDSHGHDGCPACLQFAGHGERMHRAGFQYLTVREAGSAAPPLDADH